MLLLRLVIVGDEQGCTCHVQHGSGLVQSTWVQSLSVESVVPSQGRTGALLVGALASCCCICHGQEMHCMNVYASDGKMADGSLLQSVSNRKKLKHENDQLPTIRVRCCRGRWLHPQHQARLQQHAASMAFGLHVEIRSRTWPLRCICSSAHCCQQRQACQDSRNNNQGIPLLVCTYCWSTTSD